MIGVKNILLISTIIFSLNGCFVNVPLSSANESTNSNSIENSEGLSNTTESSSIGTLLESVEITNGQVMTLEKGTSLQLRLDTDITGLSSSWTSSNNGVEVDENGLVSASSAGFSEVTIEVGGVSDSIIIRVVEDIPDVDPYTSVDKESFYLSYAPAQSYEESQYRSAHNLMSGSIADQDQAPTIAKNQPAQDGKLIRNTNTYYSSDMNTYYIVDENGTIVNQVFKGGAYVTLEEVAAYVMAFNEIPANYTTKKSGSPSSDPWGKYLRLNHSKFSGDTSRYPYEPILPNISGCGGNYQYYEMDIGTLGTDCDPSYSAVIYNNGSKITRGAARIVYANSTTSGTELDVNEKYLFYTYNHYNDFQEYLNYQGGWGKMFGNVTGGGTISSNTNYNPTVYEEVIRLSLVNK